MDGRENNKAIVRRFVTEIFQEMRPESVDELVADDFKWHRPTGQPGDRQFLRDATARMAGALKNVKFTIHDEIADGDRVAVRLTSAGTAAADFPGIEGSAGRAYSIEEIHIFRLRNGQVVEHWHQYDAQGQQRQLRGEGSA